MLVGDVSFTQNLHLGAVVLEVMDWLDRWVVLMRFSVY